MTTELELRRTLKVPADRVWRALTDPAALAAWFWPERFGTTVAIDLRVGGRYRIDDVGRDQHVQGWSDCLDRLPGWLAPDTKLDVNSSS
jgi:uncharacterized protein YndB with AHSA1/START domain